MDHFTLGRHAVTCDAIFDFHFMDKDSNFFFFFRLSEIFTCLNLDPLVHVNCLRIVKILQVFLYAFSVNKFI